MKTDTNADLTAVGAIFTILILLATWYNQYITTKKQLLKLQSNYLQAAHLVIQLDAENTALHNGTIALNAHIDTLESSKQELTTLLKIKDELLQATLKKKKQQHQHQLGLNLLGTTMQTTTQTQLESVVQSLNTGQISLTLKASMSTQLQLASKSTNSTRKPTMALVLKQSKTIKEFNLTLI